jgi:hypothetical protein
MGHQGREEERGEEGGLRVAELMCDEDGRLFGFERRKEEEERE